MSNLEKYKNAFVSSLSIDSSALKDSLKYNEIPEWDSIGHMSLISALEDEFKITIEILKKYKIEV